MSVHSLLSTLHRAIGLHEISLNHLSSDAANRLRVLQIRGAIDQMQIFVVGNTVFAPILSFQAWNAGFNALVIAWTVVMISFSWWLMFNWRKTYKTAGAAEDMDRFVKETTVNASIWCLGMAMFFPFIEGDAKTVLVTVMAGSLALGTFGFSQAPRAAFRYLGIHAAVMPTVIFATYAAWGSLQDLLLGFLSLTASAALLNAVIERAKDQMRAFRDHEELAQKTEVVDLLLKDYEEQGTEWMWRTDRAGCLVSCPRQILHLLNINDDARLEVPLLAALKAQLAQEGQEEVQKIVQAFSEKADLHDVTLPLRRVRGDKVKWIIMKGRPQFERGQFLGYRGLFADATATVEAKRQMEYLASRDPLTGTFNRNLVQSRLEVLAKARDHAIVFLIDLDGFKQVNDGYGHAIGDRLLKVAAERISAETSDSGLVARLGGDEFLVLCQPEVWNMHLMHDDLSQRILKALRRPIIIDQFEIGMSCSIGSAKFPEDTDNGLNLLNQADLALYAAKRSGRNRCVTFQKRMQEGLQKRILVTEKLRKAVGNGDIRALYQPQYCAHTGLLVGGEALARWHDPDLGAVGPDVFIPIAEESGLIHELGAQILKRACQDALHWAPQATGYPPKVAVNLSPVQVTRGNVAKMIKDALAETGLRPDQLEIEITEGVLIDDMQATQFLLDELADCGVTIALDDFGTGYSSLSYVRALPLDRLKIDKSFIFEIEDIEAQSIVSTIVGLCERLNLEVVAEGVESASAIKILQDLKCDILQGYHLSQPLTAPKFHALTEKTQLYKTM
ncbi:MAG: EAL domain-containing protein [Pseudomonadota bacterium]